MFLMLAIVTLAWAGVARAQSGYRCVPSRALAEAETYYRQLDFAATADAVSRGLEDSRNCKADAARLFQVAGEVAAARDEPNNCKRAFTRALALAPELGLPPRAPPKLRRCFEAAKAVPVSERRLVFSAELPESLPANQSAQATLRLQDPLRMVRTAQLFFRRAGAGGYTEVSAPATPKTQLEVPASALAGDEDGYTLEYFAIARGPAGQLAWAGQPADPLRVTVQPGEPQASSMLSTWWFWTAVGAVVVVGTGAIIYGVSTVEPKEFTVHVGAQ